MRTKQGKARCLSSCSPLLVLFLLPPPTSDPSCRLLPYSWCLTSGAATLRCPPFPFLCPQSVAPGALLARPFTPPLPQLCPSLNKISCRPVAGLAHTVIFHRPGRRILQPSRSPPSPDQPPALSFSDQPTALSFSLSWWIAQAGMLKKQVAARASEH